MTLIDTIEKNGFNYSYTYSSLDCKLYDLYTKMCPNMMISLSIPEYVELKHNLIWGINIYNENGSLVWSEHKKDYLNIYEHLNDDLKNDLIYFLDIL
jgi:hypothetical protein